MILLASCLPCRDAFFDILFVVIHHAFAEIHIQTSKLEKACSHPQAEIIWGIAPHEAVMLVKPPESISLMPNSVDWPTCRGQPPGLGCA
jgi:hypothetical protein